MESASEVQHLTAGIGRIVETGWRGMKRVEILERRKRPTAAEIIKNWSRPSNNLLIQQKSLVDIDHMGQRRRKRIVVDKTLRKVCKP